MHKNIEKSLNSKIWFFLLINTKSGGQWGKCYLQLKKQEFAFEYRKQTIVNVRLIDLFDHEKKEKQLKSAKQLQKNKQNDIRIIICGGDGTIMWGIQQCLRADLNFQLLSFAALPIGTGNDFSSTIGWGRRPLKLKQDDILPLKKRIIEWLQSQITEYDVWYTEISLFQNGQIYTVKNKQDFLMDKKQHKSGFVNYVGIGIDGRLAYQLEKSRSSYKNLNKVLYRCVGCLLLCQQIPEISNQLESFQQVSKEQCLVQSSRSISDLNTENSLLQSLNSASQNSQSSKTTLKPGFHGLLCLNSFSYLGGCQDVWLTKNIGCLQRNVKFELQKTNDGKIQFMGYKHQMSLGVQHLINTGFKIAQGKGPFVINFKRESLNHFNFIQIDGQGLKIRGLKQIIIKRHQGIPSSRIRVMVRKSG